MELRERPVIASRFWQWTKPQLADWLIAHGQIYPNRAGLLTWSRDELMSAATNMAIELEPVAEADQ